MQIRTVIILLLCSTVAVTANVKMGSLFQDRMVLQSGKPVAVWGSAEPGEQVVVEFAGQEQSDVAGEDGRWQVELEALEPSFDPAVMVVEASNRLEIRDVLVGEVWIASGQSNMHWQVARSLDSDLEIAGANNPTIREFKGALTVAQKPASGIEGEWRPALSEYAGGFSAVAYAFARDLQRILEVPVGIIHVSWGGSRIESWLPPEYLQTEDHAVLASVQERWATRMESYPTDLESFEKEFREWEARRDATNEGDPFTERAPREPVGPEHRDALSVLYNGMIHPLLPASVAGFIWYQGESNTWRTDEYRYLFPRMIEAWRNVFDQGDLPFYWVQLANFSPQNSRDWNWPLLREAQAMTLRLPATGQAVSIDIGDVNDIHPLNKQAVGRRLARLALNRNYGHDFVDSGPVMTSAVREGEGYRVFFTETHGGLKSPLGELKGFELAGEDGVFHPASATVEGDTVFLVADEVSDPAAVRYAWKDAPDAGLFNGAALPAVPFRTDGSVD